MEIELIICSVCKQKVEKYIGLKCKHCFNKHARNYVAENKEKVKATKDKYVNKMIEIAKNEIDRKCNLCGETKPVDNFRPERRECKICEDKKCRERYKKSVEKSHVQCCAILKSKQGGMCKYNAMHTDVSGKKYCNLHYKKLPEEVKIPETCVPDKIEIPEPQLPETCVPEEIKIPEPQLPDEIHLIKLDNNNIFIDNVKIEKTQEKYNITQIFKIFNLKTIAWTRTPRTKQFISCVAKDLQVTEDNLIYYDKYKKSSWAHIRIVIHALQWLSPYFESEVSKKISGEIIQTTEIFGQTQIIFENKSYQTEEHTEQEQKQESQIVFVDKFCQTEEHTEQKQEHQIIPVDKSYQTEEHAKQKQESQIVPLKQGGVLKFNNIEIQCRSSDGMINATQLCQAGGKKYNDWVRLKTTIEFLNELSSVAGIPATELSNITQGCDPKLQGTWVHRLVAYHYAQKLSPQFAVQVSCWLDNMQQENKINTQTIIDLQEENKSYQTEEYQVVSVDKSRQTEEHTEPEQKQESQIVPLKQGGVLKFNNIEIQCRSSDGKINATQLCQAGGKRFKNWYQNKTTIEFLNELSSSAGIPADELITYESGANENRATWVHPEVAIDIAQWISSKFRVRVNKWIYELALTGQVKIGEEKSQKELDTIWKNKCLQLETKHSQLQLDFENIKLEHQKISIENKKITVNLNKIRRTHQYVSMNLNGPCYYVYTVADVRTCQHMKTRAGKAGTGGISSIDSRLRTHRGDDVNMQLQLIISSSEVNISCLENTMKLIFRKYLIAASHEVFRPELDVNKLIDTAKTHIALLCSQQVDGYHFVDQSRLNKYNKDVLKTIR